VHPRPKPTRIRRVGLAWRFPSLGTPKRAPQPRKIKVFKRLRFRKPVVRLRFPLSSFRGLALQPRRLLAACKHQVGAWLAYEACERLVAESFGSLRCKTLPLEAPSGGCGSNATGPCGLTPRDAQGRETKYCLIAMMASMRRRDQQGCGRCVATERAMGLNGVPLDGPLTHHRGQAQSSISKTLGGVGNSCAGWVNGQRTIRSDWLKPA
jgi:hypothetical protein